MNRDYITSNGETSSIEEDKFIKRYLVHINTIKEIVDEQNFSELDSIFEDKFNEKGEEYIDSLKVISKNYTVLKEIEDENESSKKSLEEEIVKLKAEIKQLKEAGEGASEEEETTVEPGKEFTFREEKYKFKDSAPKTILFGGNVMSQDDLVADEDAILHLITYSGLIDKI